MNIQLPTGKTIYVSTYEFFFVLKEEDVNEFYQNCVADDLGTYVEHPFSESLMKGKLEIDEDPIIPDLPTEENIDI